LDADGHRLYVWPDLDFIHLMTASQEGECHGKQDRSDQGYANEAGGKLKQGAGKVIGNDRLRAKGAAQVAKGHAQKAVGKAKGAMKDVAGKIADKAQKKTLTTVKIA
jgi:uncharacterized protein YjbJ (UPF0337 family)